MQQRVESLSKSVGSPGIKHRLKLKDDGILKPRPKEIARYHASKKSFVVSIKGARTVNRHRWNR
jgi:hypothetical protein